MEFTTLHIKSFGTQRRAAQNKKKFVGAGECVIYGEIGEKPAKTIANKIFIEI